MFSRVETCLEPEIMAFFFRILRPSSFCMVPPVQAGEKPTKQGHHLVDVELRRASQYNFAHKTELFFNC